jgi:hypothetical protein
VPTNVGLRRAQSVDIGVVEDGNSRIREQPAQNVDPGPLPLPSQVPTSLSSLQLRNTLELPSIIQR